MAPPDPDTVETATKMSVQAMVILTSIPVILFALWGDYFGRYVDAQAKTPDFDRRLQAWRIHVTGLSVFILQAVIYLGSRPFRLEHPGLALLMFFVALVAQSHLQFGLEKKLRGLTATHGEHANLTGRTFVWIGLTMLAYFGAIYVSAVGAFVLARILGATQPVSVVCALAGGGTGILAGLGLAFALAPLHVRRLFPTTRVEDPELVAMFTECFARANAPVPDFYVIETDRFRSSNAMVAGFPTGRGWMRPALFVTRTLLKECPRDELRAVILHEVSHAALAHLRRRLAFSAVIVVGATLLSALLIGAAGFLPEPLSSFIRFVTPIAAFFVPFGAIRGLVREHEIEADVHAVVKLGAGAEQLGSALRRLDMLNDEFGDQKLPGARIMRGSAHPTTEERIARIEKAARDAGIQSPAPAQEDLRKSA